MTRFQRLRRADTRGQLDRGTWAALDKIKFETLVRGAGEYLIDNPPIYFGQAFDSPPFFTFSAVSGNPGTYPEVKAVGWPSVHAGIGTDDELLNAGWLPDGSFEHQMLWNDPVIPHVKDHLTYPSFQKIKADQGPGTGWATPTVENFWVQGLAETSPSQPAWAISNERAFPNAVGYRSKYAARYVFDGSGVSRWLIPAFGFLSANGPTQPYVGNLSTEPYEWHLNDVVSWCSDAAAETLLTGQNTRGIAFNPPLDEWTVNLQVYCTEEMTYEAIVRQWDDYDNSHFGGDSAYRLIQEDAWTQQIPPGQWTDVTFTYPTSPDYWPNYPETEGSVLSQNYINHTWLSRFHNLGSSGAKAFIDHCFVWPNMTTQGGLPMITIGVAEWVQDEGGAYVGAKLWIKVGGAEVTVGA